MRWIGPSLVPFMSLVLFVVAIPASTLAQSTAPSTQRAPPGEDDTRTDRPKNNDLQFLWPALKLLEDAKKRADEKARRKKESQSVPQTSEPAPLEPAATTPPPVVEQLPPPDHVSRKPNIPKHPTRVSISPKPRPESSASPESPVTPEPTQTQMATPNSPAVRPRPVPVKVTPVLRKSPALQASAHDWIGSPQALVIAGALLLLAAAGAYGVRRFLGFAAPLPHARAHVDTGTTSAPQFGEAMLSLSVMIGRGASVMATDYPQSARPA